MAAIAAIALALILVAALSGGDDNSTKHARKQPTRPTDPHAADRAAIQRTAIAYQQALRNGSPDDPCRYLTRFVRQGLEAAGVIGGVFIPSNASCAARARADDSRKGLGPDLAHARQLGVGQIGFGPYTDFGRRGVDADAHWRTPERQRILFVHSHGRWLIDAIEP